jgi:hypothetical protein
MGNRGNEEWGTKRRREITIETERVLVVRSRSGSFTAWCEECGASSSMVTPEVAAAIAGVGSREIYRWIEEEKLHFSETGGGLVFVCCSSLPTTGCKVTKELLE